MPVATTENVTGEPAVTVWLAGFVRMFGDNLGCHPYSQMVALLAFVRFTSVANNGMPLLNAAGTPRSFVQP